MANTYYRNVSQLDDGLFRIYFDGTDSILPEAGMGLEFINACRPPGEDWALDFASISLDLSNSELYGGETGLLYFVPEQGARYASVLHYFDFTSNLMKDDFYQPAFPINLIRGDKITLMLFGGGEGGAWGGASYSGYLSFVKIDKK